MLSPNRYKTPSLSNRQDGHFEASQHVYGLVKPSMCEWHRSTDALEVSLL